MNPRRILGGALFLINASARLFASEVTPRTASVVIDDSSRVPINRTIYGVNNSWREIDREEFPLFVSSLEKYTHFSLMRFPGGWEAEHYDWQTNSTPRWRKNPAIPGASVDDVLSSVPNTSFVLPTQDVMTGRTNVTDIVELAGRLVQQYGPQVRSWEIGNEWWLQNGAKKNPTRREAMLQKYSQVVAQLAPVLKAVNDQIVVYATMDWTNPSEVVALRRNVGVDAWRFVDGISLHPYCGDVQRERLCSAIGRVAQEIRLMSGKSQLYASEWSPTRRYTGDKAGMAEANLVVVALREMVNSQFSAAAYWPGARSVPQIALLTSDLAQATAPGMVFGELAERYSGSALKTEGDLPAVSAIGDDGTLRIIVPSMSPDPVIVRVKLPNDDWNKIIRSTVLEATGETNANGVASENLDVSVESDVLTFPLNGKSGGWQIATVTLSRR
jgi:hypothetical protein